MCTYGILLESKHDYSTQQKAFESVGQNSGNLLFRHALINELSLMKMTYEEYSSMKDSFEDLPIISTDMIWINENSNFDYLYNRVIQNPYTRFIPISVGLQASDASVDFKLNDSVKNTLAAIQERAIIGVRGEYTASVLEKNGIRNYEVIGCPSMYNMMNEDFKISKNDGNINSVCANFRTIYGSLSRKEKHFLSYCAAHKFSFVEQTSHVLQLNNTNDVNYFNFVNSWLESNRHIFFDVNEWSSFMKQFDFTMGARFHGNVIAIWNGVPALFIAIDSRTEELTNYFNLPTINMADFDCDRPVEYYYEKADYDVFNKTYKDKYRKFKSFLLKNGIFEDHSIR